MSLYPQAPKRSEEAAISLLSIPFLAIQTAGRFIGHALTYKKAVSAPPAVPPAVEAAPIPPPPANRCVAADRVFSAVIDGKKISFFQYFSFNQIRITSRENRLLKETIFTPALAEENSLVFEIDGAIQWIRRFGFGRAKPSPAQPASEARPPAKPKTMGSNEASAKPAANPAAAPMNIVPPTGNKGQPFTGFIRFAGESVRKGHEDQKPYTTYAVKLESETGSFEKEFIGEHLAEIVAEQKLQVGQLVRIQLLGKHKFEVEVNGKMEPRSRNHFAVTPLK